MTVARATTKPDHWMVKGGLRERWNPLGHTVLYGAYETTSDRDQHWSCERESLATVRQWGIGAVQEIDAAAMSLWLTTTTSIRYRRE